MKSSEMYVKSGTPTVYIKYNGVWDMQDLYESAIDWFRKRKYKFHEKIYKHKHPSPFGVERQYVWQATRDEEEYIQLVIDVYMHTYDAHDVEAKMKDGETKTFTKGRIWIEFKGHIIYDYKKRFEKSSFYAQLRNFYNKYIIKKRMEQWWWDMLWYREIHQLHAFVKDRLDMESKGYEHRYWTGVHR